MSMNNIYISGTGLWIPPYGITNDELMESYNAYVKKFNADNSKEIASRFNKRTYHPPHQSSLKKHLE